MNTSRSIPLRTELKDRQQVFRTNLLKWLRICWEIRLPQSFSLGVKSLPNRTTHKGTNSVRDPYKWSLSSGVRVTFWCGGSPLQCMVQLWVVWLRCLGVVLQSETLPVRFPVRACGWVVGSVPIWVHARGNRLMFLTVFPSLPLSLKIYK